MRLLSTNVCFVSQKAEVIHNKRGENNCIGFMQRIYKMEYSYIFLLSNAGKAHVDFYDRAV